MEAKHSPYLKHLYVCVNQRDPGVTCCGLGGTPEKQAAGQAGGEAIQDKLKAYVKANNLKGKVRVSKSGCMDLCAKGPNVMVYPDHQWYSGVTLEDVDRIIEEHLAPLVEDVILAKARIPSFEGMTSQGEIASGAARPRNDVRAMLFDLGNVIIRFDHREAARKIVDGTGASAEALYQLLFYSHLVIDHDEGKISTREFYDGVKRELRLTLPFEKFLEVWNDIFTPDPAMVQLVTGLTDRTPCYLISNTNRPHFEFCRRLIPDLDRFRGWILSYEVGHLKPHPAIYQRALEMIRLPASSILYVDDREDLIEAARPFGFQVHRFTGREALVEELKARGVS